jgi:hypothetical protein
MTADPWALLREARNELDVLASYVENHNTVWPTAGLKATAKAQKKMRDRIDAALAERQDSSTDVVEWEERQGSYIHDDGVNELRVYLFGDQWHWHTVVECRANGICTTEAEARRAATAAARGMR